MSNLNLKGVWIPIEILIDDNLSDKEKLIYSIILFLSKENNRLISLKKSQPDFHRVFQDYADKNSKK